MKFLLILCLLPVSGFAAQFYKSTFFQYPVNTSTQEVKEAGGINFNLELYKGFGLDLDVIQSASEDTFVDRTGLHINYRRTILQDDNTQIGKIDSLVYAGIAGDWEDRQEGIEGGVGLSFYVWKNMYAEIRSGIQKDVEDDWIFVPSIGIGYKW